MVSVNWGAVYVQRICLSKLHFMIYAYYRLRTKCTLGKVYNEHTHTHIHTNINKLMAIGRDRPTTYIIAAVLFKE